MPIIYDKKGKAHNVTHQVDANQAIQSGNYTLEDPDADAPAPVAPPTPAPVVDAGPDTEA